MFIALGGAGVVPVIHGLTIYGWQGLEDRMSLSWVIANGASNIFGAILYAVSTVYRYCRQPSLTSISYAFQRECLQAHSTSGVVLTRSSMSSW